MKNCKRASAVVVALVIGSLSCSKMETPATAAAPATTSDQINLLGDWTSGSFSHSEKRLFDTTATVSSTTQMVFPYWNFDQNGKLTIGPGAKSASAVLAFTSLPDNRLVLALKNSADTFHVQNTGNGILLSGAKNVNGILMNETLELRRTSN